jgi:hypothetical protein
MHNYGIHYRKRRVRAVTLELLKIISDTFRVYRNIIIYLLLDNKTNTGRTKETNEKYDIFNLDFLDFDLLLVL